MAIVDKIHDLTKKLTGQDGVGSNITEAINDLTTKWTEVNGTGGNINEAVTTLSQNAENGGGGGSSEIDVIYQVIPETTFIGERSWYMPDIIYFNIPLNERSSGSPYIIPYTNIDIVFDGVSYSLPWWSDDVHYVDGWGEFEYDTTNDIMVPIFTNYPVALFSDFTGGCVSDTNQHTIKFEVVDHGFPITIYKAKPNTSGYILKENGYGIQAYRIPNGESVPFAIQNMSITLG